MVIPSTSERKPQNDEKKNSFIPPFKIDIPKVWYIPLAAVAHTYKSGVSSKRRSRKEKENANYEPVSYPFLLPSAATSNRAELEE